MPNAGAAPARYDSMSDEIENGTPVTERRKVGGELVIPVAGLIFTLYYFSTILDSPWTAQISAFFVGSILTGLILAFLVRTILDVRAGRSSLGLGALIEPISLLPKRLILLGLTLAYIWLIHVLGFTITTFLFMSTAMALLTDGKRFWFIVMLSASLSLAGWALFILAFDTRFPKGPFEVLMERMF